MAKNKNRKQPGQQERSTQAGPAPERAVGSAAESQQATLSHVQGSPADVARKQQKRFGHN
ncbi:hypothetical protein [Streptomyces minutiscleroticus]|uniref:Small hydrophilic protein n=1 Tax=Streptomyces minutiscleroticus TaxID=68238 RepID=A0A918KAB3_9ACTN|nr:hypothetical protein [Streptomyces minutiscleroticus]GGX53975.1 hypothetical protein GCM10010358_04950 [Streptomyces minutiscleroticus]